MSDVSHEEQGDVWCPQGAEDNPDNENRLEKTQVGGSDGAAASSWSTLLHLAKALLDGSREQQYTGIGIGQNNYWDAKLPDHEPDPVAISGHEIVGAV